MPRHRCHCDRYWQGCTQTISHMFIPFRSQTNHGKKYSHVMRQITSCRSDVMFYSTQWYPILPQCRLPGSQPFKSNQPCPLDQIIDVGAFGRPDFPVETRVDGFLEHPSAAPLLTSRREIRNGLNCLSPEQVRESLGTHSERVLHLTRVKGVFCGFSDADQCAALDHAIVTVFKNDWCCGENGSMPVTPVSRRVTVSPSGSVDAGPTADSESISRAQEVWRLTNPETSKWQARLFGHRFPRLSKMAVHNHYSCPDQST